MNNFSLKNDFLLGVATASTQIEGGDAQTNWSEWYKMGMIKDNTSPSVCNDHYNRYIEDSYLLKEMGIKIYRMGIEWARINPSMGVFDSEVIKHYRKEIELLISLGIRPLLTLHHFSNPLWFEKLGAFTKKENVKYFLDFARFVIDNVGDIVSDYITINEPNVYASFSYLYGIWYPGHKNFKETYEVISNLSYCHIECYKMIHEFRKDYEETNVSFSNHVRVFDPAKPRYKTITKLSEYLYQGALSKAFYKGIFKWPMKNHFNVKKGEYVDFIGINYYSRSFISGLKDGIKPNTPRNDLNWEIYPKGIVRVSEKLYDIIKRPIWITENGTCDNTDSYRSLYIYEHLKEISESNLPFKRFYHWCFLDNWEWAEGESARFGIVYNDFKTQERKIKPSGYFYMDIIKNNGVTIDAYNKYVLNEKYNIK